MHTDADDKIAEAGYRLGESIMHLTNMGYSIKKDHNLAPITG